MNAPATPQLLLRIDDRRYALESRFVEEILELEPPQSLPFLPRAVRGVAMWRERPLPVVDLELLLERENGNPPLGERQFPRGVFVRCGELEAIVGCDGVASSDRVTDADVPIAIDELLQGLSER